MSSPAPNGQNNHEILSPSEAAAYMQQVACEAEELAGFFGQDHQRFAD